MSLNALFDRRPPTRWEQLLSSPSLFITKWMYVKCAPVVQDSPSTSSTIRVICISDTHNAHAALPTLPMGDILIHAGDLTNSGTEQELLAVLEWLRAQPHVHKVFIAGNHDTILANPTKRDAIISAYPELTYLEDSSTTLVVRGQNVAIYGSPRTPRHGSGVFQYPRVEADWQNIPSRTDILVTHGPPAHHLDAGGSGCAGLLQALWHVRPRLHIFGHIHAAHGVERVGWSQAQMAYERVCTSKGGWKGALYVVWSATRAWLGARPRFCAGRDTVLVNAASIGGLKDEKRRDAIVVDIDPSDLSR
ncbi:metallophosphoesterase domain-containing protein 1 [Lyophyllum atratum]|nr:metallophosphoesterase domain-containing protein 1 [Lyophyllum atratum]